MLFTNCSDLAWLKNCHTVSSSLGIGNCHLRYSLCAHWIDGEFFSQSKMCIQYLGQKCLKVFLFYGRYKFLPPPLPHSFYLSWQHMSVCFLGVQYSSEKAFYINIAFAQLTENFMIYKKWKMVQNKVDAGNFWNLISAQRNSLHHSSQTYSTYNFHDPTP